MPRDNARERGQRERTQEKQRQHAQKRRKEI